MAVGSNRAPSRGATLPGVTNPTARPAIPTGLVEGGVVAIARRVTAASAPGIAQALAEGGVRAFEITLNDPEADALRAIEAVAGAEAARRAGPSARTSPSAPGRCSRSLRRNGRSTPGRRSS